MIKLDIILLVLFLNIILFNFKEFVNLELRLIKEILIKNQKLFVLEKGSKVTTDTLFSEIEKVLLKEGVLDK